MLLVLSLTETKEQPRTGRGFPLFPVLSAIQKSIRRGDAKTAGWFALELDNSDMGGNAWGRLVVCSAEDCVGCVTGEVLALNHCWRKYEKKGFKFRSIFLAKAVCLLARVAKSRDADHLASLVYGMDADVDVEEMRQVLSYPSVPPHPKIPDYAYDFHTLEGKKAGKTKQQFFMDEYKALANKGQGFFDDLLTT